MHNNELITNKLAALALWLSDRQRDIAGSRSESASAALLSLFHHEPMTATALATTLGLSQPATVRLIDRLEAEGLARREAVPGRAVPLALTFEGRRVAADLAERRATVLDETLTQLGGEELAGLEATLDKLLTAASQGATQGRGPDICRFCDHRICRDVDCPVKSGSNNDSPQDAPDESW